MGKLTGFLISLLVLSYLPANAQKFGGRVLAENGEPVPGVTVRLADRHRVTTTRPDGSFQLELSRIPDTVFFSAAGFESYRLVVNERQLDDPHFEVVLLNSRSGRLDEVAVIGYASTAMSPLTVSGFARVPGKLAGVKLEADGRSSVSIRGRSSLTGSISYLAADADGVPDRTDVISRNLYADSTSPVLPRARLLTAGEVNDFTRWKMWEDYTENQFSQWSRHWGMNPRGRYSVQLTDASHRAVINEPVFLINRLTGDTAWRARTDNTGKAELWAGLATNKEVFPNTYRIADRSGNQVDHPAEFANGINLLRADRPCQVSDAVDIAFAVDATGSMGDEIDFLKLEVETVLRTTQERFPQLHMRTAAVFYRDSTDEYTTRYRSFQDDPLKTVNFIKLQSATGGGDYPEALDQGLSAAIDSLEWNLSARTRILFLILDAPAHDDASARLLASIAGAAAKGIRIIPIACSGTNKSTEFLLRAIALATNGSYVFLTDDSGVGNSHIKPTTDHYEVELLSNLLQRLLGQYLYAAACGSTGEKGEAPFLRELTNPLSVRINPNPTSGVVRITSNHELKDLFITDFTGKILQRLIAGGQQKNWQVDLGAFPAGIYLVRYVTPDNRWGAEKLVIAR